MDPLTTTRNRWDHLILLAVLLTLAGFYLRYQPIRLAHYTDPLVYLSGAESLAEGNGYRFVAHAGTPRITVHPPLQSAYLSLFWRLNPNFPANIPWLYAAMVLTVFATFILFYRFCRKNRMPGLVAGLLILSWGLSLNFGGLIFSFMSDVTFGLLWMILGAFWLESQDLDSARHWLITGVIVMLMYLTRTAALAVIVTFAGVAAWRAWSRAQIKLIVAYLLPVVTAIVLWNLWKAGSPSYGDYIKVRMAEQGGWSGAIRDTFDRAQDYLSGLGFNRGIFPALMEWPSRRPLLHSVWSPILTAVTLGLSWLLTIFGVAGCWGTRRIRSGGEICGARSAGGSPGAASGEPIAPAIRERIFGLVVAVYLFQLCLYPAGLGERVLFAVLPFVLVWAWKGSSLLPSRIIGSRAWTCALVIFLGLNVVGNAGSFASAMTYLDTCSHREELQEIGDWLRQNSPPETVVAATLSEPVMHFYHYSGRRVVENYFQKQPCFSIVSESLCGTRNADYLLLDWYSYLTLDDLSFRSFHLAHSSSLGRYRLYRVGPEL